MPAGNFVLNPSTGKRRNYEENFEMPIPGTMYGKDTDFSLRTDDIPGASPVKNPHLQKVLLN